jgi:hypothetical protein
VAAKRPKISEGRRAPKSPKDDARVTTLRPYTLAELERVHRLKQAWALRPWSDLAAAVGRSPEGLRQAYVRWQSGQWQPGRREAARAAREAELEQAIAEGCATLAALAARFGISRPAVHKALLNAGIDLEERLALAPPEARAAILCQRPRNPRRDLRSRSGLGQWRPRNARGHFEPLACPVKPVASSAYI